MSHLYGRLIERARRRVALQPQLLPSSREGDLQPSLAQEFIWRRTHDLAGASFMLQISHRLTGALDHAALEGALAEIVSRHQALRTTFAVVGGTLVVRISGDRFCLHRVDLRAAADPSAEARRIALSDSLRPVDLARGPLLHAHLVRVDEPAWILHLTVHHSVFDGGSFAILLGELSLLYAAFVDGRPSPLRAPQFQYSDYARWQRSWLQGEVVDRSLAYWNRRMAGVPPLALPTDRAPVGDVRGEARKALFRLPLEVSAGARALVEREQCTLFMIMLAGFLALLHCHSGQTDLLIGVFASDRRGETRSVIGLFINLLMMRVNLVGVVTFRDLLVRTREVSFEAFDSLDDALPPVPSEMTATWNSLTVGPGLVLPGLRVEEEPPADGRLGRTKFGLEARLFEGTQILWGEFVYDAERFSDERADRLCREYEAIVAQVVADPGRPLATLLAPTL